MSQRFTSGFMAFATALLLGGAASGKDMCITELRLDAGRSNYAVDWPMEDLLQVGTWDVRGGSSRGQGAALGADFISLSAKQAPQTERQCLTDIMFRSTADSQVLQTPHGYDLVGWWGVDVGGAVDSNNNYTTGVLWLYTKQMVRADQPKNVVKDVWFHVNENPHEFVPTGYKHIGRWDVEPGGGFGTNSQRPSVSCTQHPCGDGYYVGTLSDKAGQFTAGAAKATPATLDGKWVLITSCQKQNSGSCGEISKSITVGASRSVSNATVNTTEKSLSVTVGASVKSDTGAFPGGEVEASIEVSGTLSDSYSEEISDTFERNASATVTASCQGAQSLWQWQSSLSIASLQGGPDTIITAGSPRYVCAGPSARPSNVRVFDSWGNASVEKKKSN